MFKIIFNSVLFINLCLASIHAQKINSHFYSRQTLSPHSRNINPLSLEDLLWILESKMKLQGPRNEFEKELEIIEKELIRKVPSQPFVHLQKKVKGEDLKHQDLHYSIQDFLNTLKTNSLDSVLLKMDENSRKTLIFFMIRKSTDASFALQQALVFALEKIFLSIIKQNLPLPNKTILEELNSKEKNIRLMIVKSLKQPLIKLAQDNSPLPFDLVDFLGDDYWYVKCTLSEILEKVFAAKIKNGLEIPVDDLYDYLDDSDEDVRQSLIRTIGKTLQLRLTERQIDPSDTLLKRIVSDSEFLQEDLVQILGYVFQTKALLGHKLDLNLFINIILDSNNPYELREASGKALSMIIPHLTIDDTIKQISPLLKILNDSDDRIARKSSYIALRPLLFQEDPSFKSWMDILSNKYPIDPENKLSALDRYVIIYNEKHQPNSSELFSSYLQFKSHFSTINQSLRVDRQIIEHDFLENNELKITSLLQVMDNNLFHFFRNILGGKAPYSLVRFLTPLYPIRSDIIPLYKQLYLNKGKKGSIKVWKKLIEVYGSYYQFDLLDSLKEIMNKHIDDKTPLDQLYSILALNNLKQIILKFNIKTDKLDISLLERFPLQFVPNLLIGRNFIQKTYPEKLELFDQLLKALFEGETDSFLTDTSTPLGKHNEVIMRSLNNLGINASLFVNYKDQEGIPVETEFNFSERDSEIDPTDEAIKVIAQSHKLFSTFQKHKTLPQILTFVSQIESFYRKTLQIDLSILSPDQDSRKHNWLGKTQEERNIVIKRLLQKDRNNEFNKLNLLLKKIEYFNQTIQKMTFQNEQIRSHLLEECGHGIDYIKRLQTIVSSPESLKQLLRLRKNFKIRMWRRDPAYDLFLGDFVGCCLAANGNQKFQAILERLTDFAMTVCEVVDTDTDQTIALTWLFAGTNLKNKLPILVANFYEMTGTYSTLHPMRDKIIVTLNTFLKTFADKCGFQKFIARQLTYGVIPTFKEPLEQMNIGKIGEYFLSSYYLAAVENNEFHNLWERKDIHKPEEAFLESA